MAITWGAYEGGSVPLRVGIDITVSGTTATVKYYVGTGSTGAYQDNQTMNYSGSITGSTDFYNSTGNSDTQLVATKTKTVSPGSTYTFAASISGAYNGATPSHSRSYTEPVNTPSAPTGLNLSSITSDSMLAKWTQPSNWGGNDTDDYQIAWSKSSSFSTLSSMTVTNATSKTIVGLDNDTTYYVKVRGKNSAGYGSYSSTVSAKTLAGTAGPPENLTIQNIGPTTARAVWAYPLDDGGQPITHYALQLSANADFSDPINFSDIPTTVFDMTGLEPKTHYYSQVRAWNASGAGSWSPTVEFDTLAGAKVSQGGVQIDVPSFVKVAGVMTAIAPQKRKAGAWVF